ncbi:MAG: M56 family metallopeptidase [Bacteroidota bacterium]
MIKWLIPTHLTNPKYAMQIVDLLFPPQLAQSLGWTLLHSLWQGALLALVLRMYLRMRKSRSAQSAYIASLSTLLLMLVASAATLYIEYQSASQQLAQSQSQMSVWTAVENVAPALLEPGEMVWKELIPYLSVVWLAGLVFFAVRWLGGLWYLHRLRHSYTFAVDYGWQHKLNQIARKLGIDRPVQLLESGRVKVPMVLGHIKPVVLLPLGLLSGISPKQLESILAHELSHIRRYDFLVNQIVALIEMVFFYHPAYWWVANQIEEYREHCCDDLAVAVCEDAITYARMLTELEAHRQNMPMMALGMAGRNSSLFRRVQRIVQPQVRQAPRERASIIPAIMLTICMVSLLWSQPQAQTPAEVDVSEAAIPNEGLPLTVSSPVAVSQLATTASPNAQPKPQIPSIEPGVPRRGELPAVQAIATNLVASSLPAAPRSAPVFVSSSPAQPAILEDLASTVEEVEFVLLDAQNLIGELQNNVLVLVDTPPVRRIVPVPPTQPLPPAPPVIVIPTDIDWEDEEQRAAFEARMKAFEEAQEAWAKEYAKTWEKEEKNWAKEMERFEREMAVWAEGYERAQGQNLQKEQLRAELEVLREQLISKELQKEEMLIVREQARALALEQVELQREAELARIQALEQVKLMEKEAKLQAKIAKVEAKAAMEAAERELARIQGAGTIYVGDQSREYIRYQNRLLRELERDGLIDSDDTRVKVDITEDFVKVNGRRLNRSLARKYRQMAEDYNLEEGRIIFREK